MSQNNDRFQVTYKEAVLLIGRDKSRFVREDRCITYALSAHCRDPKRAAYALRNRLLRDTRITDVSAVKRV